MSVKAYILIQTEVGRAADVAARIREISGVTQAEDVTGPYDVIVRTEASSMDELGDLARASRDRLAGRLRIGVIPTIAPYLLPAIIGSVAWTHDGVDLHVRETLSGSRGDALGRGGRDTAYVALP